MLFEKRIVGAYKSIVNRRVDDTGAVRYFNHLDFRGLCASPYEFCAAHGEVLRGAFYYYGDKSFDRIVIFEHGMGGGHLSYMKEIELLCRRGYTVLSYDRTGCMTSDGDSIGGFAESLSNLDSLIKALRASDEYKNTDISVVGHSWGGFSTLNISGIHKDITHVVSLSGFISVRSVLKGFFRGPLRLYIPAIMRLEEERNPDFCNTDATLSLKSSNTKAMIIHSRDDKTVSYKDNLSPLMAALKDRPDTHFITLSDRGHNPNYTKAAVEYKDLFFKELTSFTKSSLFADSNKRAEFKASYDFNRMTEQDTELWEKIFAFLDN